MSSGFYFSREMDELGIEAGNTPLAKEARCLSWLGTAAALSTRQAKAGINIVPINTSPTPTSLDMAQLKLRLGNTISSSLTSVVRANELTGAIGQRTNFDCPPDKCASITVQKYVERLVKYTPTTPEVFVSSLIYVDRLQKSQSAPVTLTRHNIHRVFAACFVVASKFQEDTYYSNRFYAKVAGLTIEELNLLEREVLWRLGFWLVIETDTYAAYSNAADCLMQLEMRYGDLNIYFRELIKQLRACWALAAQQQQQLVVNQFNNNNNNTTTTTNNNNNNNNSYNQIQYTTPSTVPPTPLSQPSLVVPNNQRQMTVPASTGLVQQSPPIDVNMSMSPPPPSNPNTTQHWHPQ